jgi:hypothetical protein
MTLGELIAGADFAAELDELSPAQRGALAERIASLRAGELSITREQRVKVKRKGRRSDKGSKSVTIDLGERLVATAVDVEQGLLRFRLRSDLDGPSARPREVVECLVGHAIDDHRIRRERLLSRDERGELVGLRERGPVWRPLHRHHGGARRAGAEAEVEAPELD